MARIGVYQQVVLLLVLLVQVSSVFGDHPDLAIFVDNSYPPYMYEPEEKDVAGLYPKLLLEIISGTSVTAEIVAVPWKRALLYGGDGVGAVGGAYKNDKRLKKYDYSAPLYEEKMVIFVNKGQQFEYNDLDDLSGKTIGVNRGWSYGQKFDAAREKELFKVNVRADLSDNFKMLALGRIDCLILDQLSGESYIQHLGLNDKIVALPVPFSLNNSHLIIPKELDMKAFLKEFDASLAKMREAGTYDDIVQQFIQDTVSSHE
ncbi:hypothetical protein A3742_07885 [Oleiphilus sp. HI0071]|uniref:substrate-binding periplasmic protein n=1 Tax=Oleiphilus sp. HI0080 TaxID=1822255 RepID=UPI0007C256E3|nr:transporter substrate-binding domain-containing protein [Oleiphilus sp. HI0080]KZY67183.1 hypothetical protein A3737_12895 [Oleiphilus sp. HI0065]KZY83124.1 hypothetical protein A3742_07885 [Oleiphilus sp. HI0071]KZY91942.1 hypothetical protein A3744_03640 [Oleiphilus sp. HI0073]KZZ44318.1 hypothetical protein A3758_14945 [Oleiphilus sp. HI0118]KZZ61544.1 hypothetical protein A3760_15775 [Oleiphilus sp. HI0122]KZZ74591.1 hypothetical protein A3765_11300 [Oleiphilus sp. HI0130]KZZ80602.1 h